MGSIIHKETLNHSTMYSLNKIEKKYNIEELKQDWLFKLLCKFLKLHSLFNAMTKRKEFFTMHSNNYCVTKMFFLTITVTVPKEILDWKERLRYDKLWTEFILKNLNCIPSEVEELVLFNQQYNTLEEYMNIAYRSHYHEERAK